MTILAASALLLAPVAAADPIVVGTPDVGGYTVVATADFAPFVNPNPGAPGVTVTSEAGDYTVNEVSVKKQHVCVVDETVLEDTPLGGQDIVPCEEQLQANVATPCEALRQEIREAPVAGGALDGAINTASGAADSTVQVGIDAVESTGLISNAQWNDATARLSADCSGATQAVATSSTVNASQLIVNINNPTVCFNPNQPLLCPGVIDIDDQIREGTDQTQRSFDTFSCDFHGAVMDCTNVTVGDNSVDLPLEKTQEVVAMLPDEGGVFVDSKAPNATTGSAATKDYTLDTGSIASCTASGRPRDPDGNSDIVPVVGIGVTPSGHDLPDGALDPAEAALDTADMTLASAANALTAAFMQIVNLWTSPTGLPGPFEDGLNSGVMKVYNDAEGAVYDGWPFADQVLDGTPSDGAVQPDNGGGCGATPPPTPDQPDVEAPVVPLP